MPRVFLHLIAAVLACAFALRVDAAEPLGAEWTPVDPARLEALRGGFVVPSGLVVAFGIERVVSVNGQVVASTQLRIPDLARITGDEAAALAALRDSQVVHVGAGTLVSGDTGGLVIQNAVDGQAISARTSLDVGVNTLPLFRDAQLAATITNAVVAGLPSH